MARIIRYVFVCFFIPLFFSGCLYKKQTPYVQPSLFNQQGAQANAHEVFNYLHKGYTDRASEKLQLALQQGPQDPVVLDTAGYYYEKTGDLKIANYYYKKAVMVAPDSAVVKNNYGSFLCRNGHYRKSLPYFYQAAAIYGSPVRSQALQNAEYCKDKIETKLGD